MLRYFAYAAVLVPCAIALALAGAIAFGAASPPPPVPSLQSADAAIGRALAGGLPSAQSFAARDGTQLAYRTYPASQERSAVLIHGSSGWGGAVHGLAAALQQAGVTVYVPDMRGHGGSGENGDIAYIGQLEDDLVDLLEELPPLPQGGKHILMGHSSGGGFVLRFAGGDNGERFDGYALLAPYLRHDAPTVRPNSGGWAAPYVPRIVALEILSRFGIHWFEGLPVLAFAISPEDVTEYRTPRYSYRLMTNFGPHRDWQADIERIRRPAVVLVGADDELFRAEAFAPTFGALRPDIPVKVVPHTDHMGLVTEPEGQAASVEAFRTLAESG